MTTAAALPLVNVTGDAMIRLGAKVQPGQTVLITGALGGVGRSAVFAASQIGARVIAGVRGKRLDAARQLPGVGEAIAIDDDAEIDKLGPLDCVADIVGGELAGQLLARVKEGGTFGCFPTQNPRNAALHPTIQINIVIAPVNSATILRYAEAVRDGKLTIPVERIMLLADAAEAQAIAEKGGTAKIILTA
jgi:NADPH:quinone reductase-like Zn-dependent oxidoreductase